MPPGEQTGRSSRFPDLRGAGRRVIPQRSLISRAAEACECRAEFSLALSLHRRAMWAGGADVRPNPCPEALSADFRAIFRNLGLVLHESHAKQREVVLSLPSFCEDVGFWLLAPAWRTAPAATKAGCRPRSTSRPPCRCRRDERPPRRVTDCTQPLDAPKGERQARGSPPLPAAAHRRVSRSKPAR